MMTIKIHRAKSALQFGKRRNERGAALIMSLLIMALVGVIAMSVLAVVTPESNIAGSDLRRTQTFYATTAGMEKMTYDLSNLFARTTKPTQTQLNTIAAQPPPELQAEGFSFQQTLSPDDVTLAEMRRVQNITNGAYPRVTIPSGPFTGLLASVSPFRMTSIATHRPTQSEVSLTREINNYLIPLFQFGTFSDKDLEFWPEPPMTFNGRVHANGNIYFGGDITFLSKVTTANEAVRTVLRNNGNLTYYDDPRFNINGINVRMTQGSVTGGPNLTQPRADGRGKFTDSPNGTDNVAWKTNSIAAAANNTPNQFGGQLLTASTGAVPLLLPLQLAGRQAREIIKRAMPSEPAALSESRYQNKAQIRIYIDDENAGTGAANRAGIPADKGVYLSVASGPLAFNPLSLDGGSALRIVNDSGDYATPVDWDQGTLSRNLQAETVRGVRNYTVWTNSAASLNATAAEAADSRNASIPRSPNGAFIPPGAGITGHILIEVVAPDDTTYDVTKEILSMGMTVGEPNGIVYLQRPAWAAFMQGSRNRKGSNEYLTYFLDNSVTNRRCLADGEINAATAFSSTGYIYNGVTPTNLDDDPHSAATPFIPNPNNFGRNDKIPTSGLAAVLNRIVPINVYNVREGRINELGLSANSVYQRGITSVIEINMRNLARWVDGVYDDNLLNGTNAVSSRIDGSEGYVVYISDRRGDRVKNEIVAPLGTVATTNGMVDNEDVYGYNQSNGAVPDPGEDVIDDGVDPATGKNKKGSLQIDTLELPSPVAIAEGTLTAPTGVDSADFYRAMTVANWNTASPNYFRRAVRLFNGENLRVTGATGKLSQTKGITVATENMAYIWGNYNTTGITSQPAIGSTLNEGGYTGPQVPTSIVADAFFPLSKTWYDSLSAMYPEGGLNRVADAGSLSDIAAIPIGQETSVRAGIIAGQTLSAKVGTGAPTYFLQWLNGGVHNFPRFLETWSVSDTWEKRWNYVGSFILLYNSTQAVGPYSVVSSVVYAPPKRNWAFDITFTDPSRLPPGTPLFQYVEATGFRQDL